MTKKNLLILFGGRSGEHEVSLSSARSVLSVLNTDKYNIIQVGITHSGRWLTGENTIEAFELGRTNSLTPVVLLPEPDEHRLFAVQSDGRLHPIAEIDIVFPVLHGTFGEDGSLQGLLELAGLPYVGAGVVGSAVGMDKGIFKTVMQAEDIPVLPCMVVTRHQVETDLNSLIDQAETLSAYPLFTKPVNLGSSVGITKCQNRSDLGEGLMDAARFDRRILIERGLEKPREIEVSVLGNEEPQASLPGEVIPSDNFYSYDAKYIDDRSQLVIPAPLPDEVANRARELAVRIYRAIDCAGMARVDFLLDRATNELYVSEVNTIPGFTRISMYPKLWEATGLSYPALVERLLSLALERKADRDRTEYQYRRAR